MNKKIVKFLTISFFMFFAINSVQASFLWDLNVGIDKYRKDRYKEAKNYFEEYVKSNPNDKDGYYWLARACWKLDDNKCANINFKKSYELTSKERNIGKIEFEVDSKANIEDYFDMATMFFESGNFKEADSYADLMLKVNSKSSSAYFIKAKVAQVNNQTQKAVEYINKAILYNNKLIRTNLAKSLNITQMPQMSPEMYETYALEEYFSADIMSAIKYSKKYLEINPNNLDVTNMLVDLYIKNNELILAQDLINNIRANFGDNIQTLLHQAKIQELKKDATQETTLLTAYKINPNNQQVLLELGNYYLKRNNPSNALKYFETLMSVNDSLYEGYFGYIYSLCETGKTELAMNLIRKFVAINPMGSEGDFLLAKICENKGNFREANDYLVQAIAKNQNPYYFLTRAKINYLTKKYRDSIADLKVALTLSPDAILLSEIQDYLISNYLKTNDVVNAQIYLNKKSSLDKNRLLYKYNLYNLYKLQGSEEIANETLKEIKSAPLKNPQDYIDLSEIYYDLVEFDDVIKVLNKGIKKYPQDLSLVHQKNKVINRLR